VLTERRFDMIREFRAFIDRGSFIDLAVAFVMGAAVTTVITTLVERLLMPLIALAIGQPNFDAIGTFGDDGSIGAVVTSLVNFLLVAFVLFLIVRGYNRLRPPPEPEDVAAADAATEQVLLLREIRDRLTPPPT
jgi:large conductance mechanosensitive channel